MAQREILLIDDDENSRLSLCEILQMQGYSVMAAATGEEGLRLYKENNFKLVLTDLRLPGLSGIDVIKKVKSLNPHTEAIILTGYATVETAVEAMRAGAFSYLRKPFGKDELLVTLERALEHHRLKTENTKLKSEIRQSCAAAIIGTSQAVVDLKEGIEKVADTDSTVLILGESGTGKELVAKALHYGSSRCNKPFVPINCAAIPEDLLESELFGFEKGAFTGAIAAKAGRFEVADGGTIFLDEIGDMSPGLQVKILRVLQEKEFERIGARSAIKVDVRVVAATNQDLERAVENKKFRKDLYYRLNVIPIHTPTLRERRDDIQILFRHFLDRRSQLKKKEFKGVTPETMKALQEYDWPGNIRELENLVERLVVLKENGGTITIKDLPEKIRQKIFDSAVLADNINMPVDGIDFNAVVDNFEKDLILTAMSRVGGVKKKAAEYLGLNRTTLIEKMKRKGMLVQADDAQDADELTNL